MKALRPVLALIFLSMLVYKPGMAQKTSYTNPGGWTIGIGGGYAYQKSDIANSRGFGLDFIVGSQLYQRENAFLSVDWKFRFLAGQNKAYDHRINPDDTYSNIRYSFFNYDLELGLTLNRLRERTGIILTGFAGAGLTHGRTFTDLYDAGNNLYDYSGIDPNRDSKLVYQDLVALSDGDFETGLVNKVALLPTAGIYLGYQLSRSLAIGLEFKSNFCLTEENSAVGIDIDNKIIDGSGIDRNNYVSLGISWNLRGGSSRRSTANTYSTSVANNNNPVNYTNPVNPGNHTVTASHLLPSVNITNPPTETAHTETPIQTIKATIHNVSGPENISFYYNGFPNNNFTYNATTSTLIASIRLREGENSIRINATNQESTAEDRAMIILGNPLNEAILPPEVEFTSPRGDQITTSSERIDVTSSVKHISSKQHIQLFLNGNNTPFEYYPISGMVKAGVSLEKGGNHLLIKGFNEAGSAQDQLEIQFIDPEKIAGPAVWFINPEVPMEVINRRFPLSAETQNVRGRNNVRVKLNGSNIQNFSFNVEGMVSASLFLAQGVNTLEVTARNETGTASESTFITYYPPVQREPIYQEPIYQEPIYQEPVYQEPVYQEPIYHEPVVHVPVARSYPPVIKIFSPHINPFRTLERSEDLHATVQHVNSRDNIALYLNGMNLRNFNFNNGTKSLTARLALREGENILSIIAQNEAGEDLKEQVIIKESKPCPVPVIRQIDPVQGQSSTNQQTYNLRLDVRNISDRNQLKLTVNRNPVSFSFSNHVLSASFNLKRGLNSLSLIASNECGEDHYSTRISYNPTVIIDPCTPPVVSFNLQEVNRNDATHELSGSVSGVKNKADISLTLDGKAYNSFQFVPASGELSAKFKLTPGSHTVVVAVNNSCGTDNRGTTVNVAEPCSPPGVSFTLYEVNRNDATHELSGSVSGVKNKADISLTLDGKAYNAFQFVPSTGELSAKFKLTPGTHAVMVSVNNACGTDTKSGSVTLEEDDDDNDADDNEDCGIRINPGNSSWQFCLVTPSGTYSRDDLTNSNFSYSGAASSIFFMPIAGGGEATVNGQAYAIQSGKYYLFSGNLNVSVSTKNPGAMGHWSVCISASNAPVSGNGKNRPQSPCEVDKNGSLKGAGVNNGSNNSNNNRSNSGSGNVTNTRTNYRTNNGSGNVSNTRTNYRTNTRTNTNTIYRTDNSAKKSTSGTSADSTSSKTNTRTTNRTTSRTKR